MLFLMFSFQVEGDVYVICLFNIFTSYYKLNLFQLLYRGIHMHIPVLTEFKMDASVAEKVAIFGRKKPVLKLNWKGSFRVSGNGSVEVLTI